MSILSAVATTAREAAEDAFVVEDRQRGEFKVNRRSFVDEQVLELERRVIFDRCWLYLGHASEVPAPGCFLTRMVAGRPLIFNRDRAGKLHAFYNTCSHRGALVCRELKGRGHAFYCSYHGWAYNDAGALIGMPGKETMAPALLEDGHFNLREVPKLAEYAGFVFICLDPDAGSLEDYLAGARDLLDLISQQGPQGIEIISGEQQYSINANWKLLAENSIDAYHAATTHITYLEYLGARDRKSPTGRINPPAPGGVHDFGNGHAMMENPAGGAIGWGRPVARWVPGWGEAAKAEVDDILREVITRLGEERGRRVALRDRNSVIFPNLVINDVMAVTVRTFYPLKPDYMEVSAWATGPVGESAGSRDRRLKNFVEFLGPGGFATPDDVEMLELCQRGYMNRSLEWNDISRGLLDPAPSILAEEQMRIFWRRWRDLMARALRGDVG